MISKIINNESLRLLLDSIPACIFIKDANSRFVFMNRACEEAWQVQLDDVLGNDGGHLWPADQQAFFLAADKKVFAGKSKVEFEEWLLSAVLQKNRLYFTTKMPTYDASGQPEFLIAICQDITEQKQHESQVLRLTNLYKALSEVNQAIVRMSDEALLFPLVCRCAVELAGMQMAWIGQLDVDGQRILPVAKFGQHLAYLDKIEVSADARVPEGRGPVATTFRENKIVVINNIETDPTINIWRSLLDGFGWKSMAAFPIHRNHQPYAVLCVYHNQQGAFDELGISLLDELCKDITFALESFDREAQRKRHEEFNKLAALVYEASSEAMMVTDPSHHIVSVNHAFTEITGYTESEIIGVPGKILSSGKHDAAFYQAMGYQMRLSGKWHGEIWNKRKDGEIFPNRLTLNTVYNNDGSVKYWVSLFTDISQQKQDEEMIWRQSNVDALTGLPNRRMFHQNLEQEIKKSNRSGLPLVLMFLDLDNFKEVNDSLGHAMGDLLLKQASERLKLCVREFDSIARLGGDEFTIILSEVDNLKGADRVVEAILAAIAEPFQLKDKQAFISVSIGVTLYPNDAADSDTLLKNADQAMYAAKSAGRNQFSYFTHGMQEAAQKRMRMAVDLRSALQGGQLWVAYQPILDMKSGHIVKAEALARWTHPVLGSYSPSEFIPIAEHTGLIIDIGQWIFEQVMLQLKRWQKVYRPDFQVSINKSPLQINNKANRYASWGHQLAQVGLPGKSIVVEITEGLLLDANTVVNSRLLEYRDAGIQVALDDFGTGYSSLSYLKKFDIDYIKIDKTFVSQLAPNSDDLALCEAMILMAHKLGIKVIAEGIETEEQQQLLSAAGCDLGQGFLFSVPLPADEFEEILLKSAGLKTSGWR